MNQIYQIVLHALILAVTIVCAVPASAKTEKVALVFSTNNSTRAANDVALLAAKLKSLEFSVWQHKNLDRAKVRRAIADFVQTSAAEKSEKLLFFYYQGSALQLEGENYLIPAGAKITSKQSIKTKGFRMSSLVEALQRAGAKNNVFVFHSAGGNGSRLSKDRHIPPPGLAPFVAPFGSIIAFSSHPGKGGIAQASSQQKNSDYALALAKAIAAPGIGIEDALRAVRAHMVTLIPSDRAPWENSSLSEKVFLAGGAKNIAPAPKLGDEREKIAAQAWQKLEHSSTLEQVETFLKIFGDTAIAREARKARTFLKRERAQKQAASATEKTKKKAKPKARGKIAQYFPRTAQSPILKDRTVSRQWDKYVKGFAGRKYTFSHKAKGRDVAARLKFGPAFAGLFNEVRRDISRRKASGERINRKKTLQLMRKVRDEQRGLDRAAGKPNAKAGLIVYIKSLQAGVASYPLPWRPKPDFGLIHDQMVHAYPELKGVSDRSEFVADADPVFFLAKRYYEKHKSITISDIIKMLRKRAIR